LGKPIHKYITKIDGSSYTAEERARQAVALRSAFRLGKIQFKREHRDILKNLMVGDPTISMIYASAKKAFEKNPDGIFYILTLNKNYCVGVIGTSTSAKEFSE